MPERHLPEGTGPAAATEASVLPPWTIDDRAWHALARVPFDDGKRTRALSFVREFRSAVLGRLDGVRDRDLAAEIIRKCKGELLVALLDLVDGPIAADLVAAELAAEVEGVVEPAAVVAGEPMPLDEIQRLIDGPLSHPLFPFRISRLALALADVIQSTGAAGAAAFRAHCRGREDLDRLKAGEDLTPQEGGAL